MGSTPPLPSPPRRHLLLFTKHPTPGYAKTRLIPALGAAAAAALSRSLSEHALAVARAFVGGVSTAPADLVVWYAPAVRKGGEGATGGGGEGDADADAAAIRAWLGEPRGGEAYRRQPVGDLGTRLVAALTDALGRRDAKDANDGDTGGSGCDGGDGGDGGDDRPPLLPATAVVMGADIPGITPADLEAAFTALEVPPPPSSASSDASAARPPRVVLGPAADGGFYLLGMAAPPPPPGALDGLPWGGADARSATAERLGAVVCGRMLRDVDEPADVEVWETVRQATVGEGMATGGGRGNTDPGAPPP